MESIYLPSYNKLIPGTAETIDYLKQHYKLKIGNIIEFQRSIVDSFLVHAHQQGYFPDVTVANDEVDRVPPSSQMLFKNMQLLQINNFSDIVKVDSTIDGIREGINAGCWTVGI